MGTPPAQLGPYLVQEELGRGGMAVVYRAVDSGSKREVALKLLDEDIAKDQQFVEQFRTERRVSMALHHDRLVQAVDSGEIDGRPYLAMELLPGGDLQQSTKAAGGSLPLDRALTLVRDCAQGLGAIHAHGLVHRDIKPGNIYLDGDGRAKLGDLGLAGLAKVARERGVPVGTPAYLSPEQARGDDSLDIRSDIYALGATLYRLLSGRLLYDAPDAMEVVAQVLQGRLPHFPDMLPDCDPALHELLARCLAARPDHRPADPDAFVAAVDKLRLQLSGHAIGAAPAGPRSRADVDSHQLAVLAKMVVVEQGGLRASVKMAPGAAFPRDLLELMLAEAEVRYGIIEANMTEATRPCQRPRRLIMALGDEPAPGCHGVDVHGDPVAAPLTSVVVRLSDDGMEALALTRPKQAAEREELLAEIRKHRLRHGLIATAVERCTTLPGAIDGRTVIARGTPMKQGQPAGFVLRAIAQDGSHRRNDLVRVRKGDPLGYWQEEEPGAVGMDVTGRRIAPPPLPTRVLHDCYGDGTDMERRDGRSYVIATRAGVLRQLPDGAVQVVDALEIDGDIGADDEPVVSNQLVVIRGSVGAGARIAANSDVVITGDLHDAQVIAGGDLEIHGAIASGSAELVVGGALSAEDLDLRQVIAGDLRVAGTIRNAQIQVSGFVEAEAIIGGTVIAGAGISADRLGDRHGTTTEVWAGHRLHVAQLRRLDRMRNDKLRHERERLLDQRKDLAKEAENILKRDARIAASVVVDAKGEAAFRRRFRQLEARIADLDGESEDLRGELAEKNDKDEAFRSSGENAALIEARQVANGGVIAALGDAEPELLPEPRLRFRLAFDQQ